MELWGPLAERASKSVGKGTQVAVTVSLAGMHRVYSGGADHHVAPGRASCWQAWWECAMPLALPSIQWWAW